CDWGADVCSSDLIGRPFAHATTYSVNERLSLMIWTGVHPCHRLRWSCQQLQCPRWRVHLIELISFLGESVEETADVFDVRPQVVAAMEARASAVDVDALTNRTGHG